MISLQKLILNLMIKISYTINLKAKVNNYEKYLFF